MNNDYKHVDEYRRYMDVGRLLFSLGRLQVKLIQ